MKRLIDFYLRLESTGKTSSSDLENIPPKKSTNKTLHLGLKAGSQRPKR